MVLASLSKDKDLTTVVHNNFRTRRTAGFFYACAWFTGGTMKMDTGTTATTISTAASYTIAGANTGIAIFLDKFTTDEWTAIGIIGGLAFGFLTWLANVYFQNKRLKLEEQRLRKSES